MCNRCGKKFNTATHSRSMAILMGYPKGNAILPSIGTSRIVEILVDDFGWNPAGKWPMPCNSCATEIYKREMGVTA